jgi:excisionase family DNA binding protein
MSNPAESVTRSTEPRFHSVAEVARIFGTSRMTIYRAVREGELPAVRVRGRLFIPSRVLEAMVETACAKAMTASSPSPAEVAR